MASLAKSGLKALVSISTDGGTVYTAFSEGLSSTLNVGIEMAEVTNRTSSTVSGIPWVEQIPVVNSWSASIDGNLIDSAQQQALDAAILAHTALKFRFALESGTGKRMFSCDGYVSSGSRSFPQKAASTVTYQISPASALTAGTQP